MINSLRNFKSGTKASSAVSFLNEYPVQPTTKEKKKYKIHKDIADARAVAKEAIRATTGPLLEIGGPSKGGFRSLDGLRLPHGLIVSNLAELEGVGMRADARRFPFRAHSLGGVVMKALYRVPEGIAQQVALDAAAADENLGSYTAAMDQGPAGKSIDHMLRLLWNEKDTGDVSGWNDPSIMSYSLRLAMLREARRTVEAGGVLVVRNMLAAEEELAERLGFKARASVGYSTQANYSSPIASEIVMTLDDMHTPAGQLIDATGPLPLVGAELHKPASE